MSENILYELLFPLVISIATTVITVRITNKYDKKKSLNERERDVYEKATVMLLRIKQNPFCFYNHENYQELERIGALMRLYAKSDINEQFNDFFSKISESYYDFHLRLSNDEDNDIDMIYFINILEELKSKDEDDYMLDQFIKMHAIKEIQTLSDLLEKRIKAVI